ncbi:MAG TPA: alanine--tRNA ligase [Syntrophomonadaceae bacterium]|nr:alanine--tRNA ligase [Syntrophomonadaceae bacterium]
MWTSSKIRKTFLDYFAQRGHTVVDSSSLVPAEDPTLLFANAGMNQFKDIFLGLEKRNYVRATTSQKCVRAGGKHNDLDTVGRTARHHTFFEMLGNFSFGDYFKREAIQFAWEFLTDVIGLPRERLWVTIYQDDDEAQILWQEITGIDPARIVRLGAKDNFWSMGDTGPCGPCSEIMFDRGAHQACGENCALGVCDCDRYLEIWNLVFMQFNRDENGDMTPLPRPSIDTGMGLERLASVLQDVPTNFDTDLFKPIIGYIEDMTGCCYQPGEEGFPFRVIADHSRACTFLIGDGVLPSNEGRGYVLRRILRRAVRFGKILGLEEPFLYRNVDVVCDLMQEAYPDLEGKRTFIKDVILLEEERFFITLNEGLKKVEEIIRQGRSTGEKIIKARDAFMLYDTYGFPLDLTEDTAEENGFTVDKEGFNSMMEEQRIRARQANKIDGAFGQERLMSELLQDVAPTVFSGYTTTSDESAVLAIIQDDELRPAAMDNRVLVVTGHTPFYAQSGGQMADTGYIKGPQGILSVNDVQKVGAWFLHLGQLQGTLMQGDMVVMEVAGERRLDTARHHTATHLLHRALREVLGEHAQQKGSLVEESRLRFDFSHLAAMEAEEIKKIEKIVNEAIWRNMDVSTTLTDVRTAREMGAMALFGEKYGEEVRVVQVADFSRELCGGTHVSNTGQIGIFKILSEGSIGSGLRRIEAVAGRHAFAYLSMAEEELKRAAAVLKVPPQELESRVGALNRGFKEKEKEIEQLKSRMSRASSQDILDQAQKVGDASLLIAQVSGQDAGTLRKNAEILRDKLGKSIVLLASEFEGKVVLACFVSKDLLDSGLNAGEIVGTAARVTGGGGGGRPDMAQAGGKNPEKIPLALEEARKLIGKYLS